MVSSGLRIAAVLFSIASAARHDVHQHREGAEAKVVPRPISLALRRAARNAEQKLVDLQNAESTAQAAKEISETAATRKMSLMEEMKAKTTEQHAQVETSRKAMAAAEQAASQHANHSGDLEAAVAKWNGLSQAVEGMQENVTMMEEAVAATLARMKAHLEELKDELDAKVKERDVAEQEMMEKKTVVMSANKLKARSAKAATDAEQVAQKAQQDLRSLQASFDTAVSKATKAAADAKEAANAARDARNEHDAGRRTVELMNAVREAVNDFYGSVDNVVVSEHTGGIETDPKLKTAYEMYNNMATAFLELQKFSPDKFQEIKNSISEIEANYKSAIAEKCDPNGRLMNEDFEPTPEFEEQCGDGLWGKVGMTRLEIPV